MQEKAFELLLFFSPLWHFYLNGDTHDLYLNTYLLDYLVDWEHAFLFWPHLWLGPNSIHAHLQMISETRIEDFLPCLFFLSLCLRSLEFWYACLEKMIHSNLSWCSLLHNSFECRHHNLKLQCELKPISTRMSFFTGFTYHHAQYMFLTFDNSCNYIARRNAFSALSSNKHAFL